MTINESSTQEEETLPHIVEALRRRGGDSTTIEVKSAQDGCPKLGPTLSAFGNMPGGGTIILGLDEHRGFEPVGLTDIATLEQGVAGQARDAVEPPVTCSFSTVEFEGCEILIVNVEGVPLSHRPVYYKNRAYLRQSDGDYPMSDLEIAQINLLKTQQTRPTRPDLDPVHGTSYESLANDLVETYVENVRKRSRRLATLPETDLLKATGVLSITGETTLAGLYALGSHPQGQRPALGVTAAVQMPTGSATRNRDLAHFNGPMPDLLDDAMQWISRNTPSDMGYDGQGRGRDFSALPMRAVRELVANALVHRNLDGITDNKRVEIRIKDDKLIISSPGGLCGLSLEQLGKPNGKSAVNPALYEICKDVRSADGARLIEGEGGGIREVRAAAEEYGLPEPIFRDYGVSFVAILYWRTSPDVLLEQPTPAPRRAHDATGIRPPALLPDPTSVSKNAPQVWAALEEPQSFSSLVTRSGLTVNATRWALNRLIDSGHVEMLGTQGDKGTTYRRILPLFTSKSGSQ